MNQKGGIALILLMLIVLGGLAVGVYFISSKTGFFSFAGSAQVKIPYASPKSSSSATPVQTASPSAEYQNPFEESDEYANPFEEDYQNPFNSL